MPTYRKCSNPECRADIVWRTLADYHTGQPIAGAKPNPIDADPVPEGMIGNILLLADDEHYVIVPITDREMWHGYLHLSHFATCINSASFKRNRRDE